MSTAQTTSDRRADRSEGETARFTLSPLPRPLRAVAIGGGTGLPAVLDGLRRIRRRLGHAFSLEIR